MSPKLLLPVLVLALVCEPALVEAKGGPKGKGFGGSGFKAGGRGGAASKFSRPGGGPGSGAMKSNHTLGHGRGSGSANTLTSQPTTGRLKGRDHALNVQRANEERKLGHRQQTAEKLRQIAERNGNENLLRTADKMDQQALDHYNKRLSKIDAQTPQEVAERVDRVADGGAEASSLAERSPLTSPPPPADAAGGLQDVGLFDPALPEGISPDNARRLAHEDWKLQHQLDVAQRLRDNAARNGNENLLRTAERMESMAAERYQAQLEKFGLLEALQSPTVPTEPVALPGT
jgi:hypothetical protein